MKLTNKLGLPQALYDAVANDPYDNGGAWRSVTQLISPPRLIVLKRKYENEIEEDCSDRLFSLYGQIVHGILERANTGNLVEERLFMGVNGKTISGAFDTLELSNGKLSDWKFSTIYKSYGLSLEWEWQMNLLAVLFRETRGIEIKEAEIVLLMRDHSKGKAKRDATYPQHPAQRIAVPVWPKEKQMFFLFQRVNLHLAAETVELPLCDDVEQWRKATVFAVMKKGRKSAVKLYDVKDFAVTHCQESTDYYLEERPGEAVRCNAWCPVAPFCSQFQSEQIEVK